MSSTFTYLSFFFFTLFVFSGHYFPSVRSEDVVIPEIRLPSEGDDSLCTGSVPPSCPVNCFRTDPVCGVDGVTYWCGCADALCAGTRVAKVGFCEVGNGGNGPVSGYLPLGLIVFEQGIKWETKYPLVHGHEIVGMVKEVGTNVHGFKTRDHVGVGTYVNSCTDCEYCNDGVEVHCLNVPVFTFNGINADHTITKGGYSSTIVVHGRYCYKISEDYLLASATPLLCSGITVYTPLCEIRWINLVNLFV